MSSQKLDDINNFSESTKKILVDLHNFYEKNNISFTKEEEKKAEKEAEEILNEILTSKKEQKCLKKN